MRQAIHDNITPSKSENTTQRQAPPASDSEAVTRSDMMNMTVKMSALASAAASTLHDVRSHEALCEVASLAIEHSNLVRVYNEIDAVQNEDSALIESQKEFNERVILDRLDVIAESASYLLASSDVGAAFQMMLASADHSSAACADDEYYQGRLCRRAERLTFYALEYMVGDAGIIRHSFQYLMGDHMNPHSRLGALLEAHPETR